MRTNKQQGFSLIELLVVVAIMLIVAAIAVPQVVASIQRGNEASAANNLRAVVTAENHYYQQYGGFAAKAADLADESGTVTTCGAGSPGAAGLGSCMLQANIGDVADAGTTPVAGYLLKYKATGSLAGTGGAVALGTNWAITATPATTYKGARNYCADSSGTIVYGTTTPTTALTLAAGLCPAADNTAIFALGS